MAMAKVCDHQADAANFACPHHGARLAHHGVGRIGVIHREDLAGFLGHPNDLFAFFHGHRHRLLAQDVEACFEKRFGNFEVGRIGRGHSHQIHPVLARSFPSEHFRPIAISAVSGKAQALGIGATLLRPVVQRTCDKFKEPVGLGAQTVCRSDLAAFAAPDHAPFQLCHGDLSLLEADAFQVFPIDPCVVDG